MLLSKFSYLTKTTKNMNSLLNSSQVLTYLSTRKNEKNCFMNYFETYLLVVEPSAEFTGKLPPKTSIPEDTDGVFTVQVSKPDATVTWFR